MKRRKSAESGWRWRHSRRVRRRHASRHQKSPLQCNKQARAAMENALAQARTEQPVCLFCMNLCNQPANFLRLSRLIAFQSACSWRNASLKEEKKSPRRPEAACMKGTPASTNCRDVCTWM
eukprot:1157788-Pelagomonas_calceolata.AAC.1